MNEYARVAAEDSAVWAILRVVDGKAYINLRPDASREEMLVLMEWTEVSGMTTLSEELGE